MLRQVAQGLADRGEQFFEQFEKTQNEEWVSFDIDSNLEYQHLYRIPKLTEIKHFNVVEKDKDDEIGLLAINVAGILNSKFKVYENRVWEFTLPPSGFHSKQQVLVFQQHQFKSERIRKQELSEIQLNELWETGQFDVASSQPDFPYTWKISTFILKGCKNIQQSFHSDCSLLFWQIYQIPKRLTRSKSMDTDQDLMCLASLCKPNIYTGLMNAMISIPLMISILIGFKRMFWQCDETQLKNEIEKDRQIALLQNNFDFNVFKIFKQMQLDRDSGHNELLVILRQIQREFENIQRDISMKIEEVYLFHKDQQFLNQYNIRIDLSLPVEASKNKVYSHIICFLLEKSARLQKFGITQDLIRLIQSMTIIDYNQQVLKTSINTAQKQIKQQIVENHPYRSPVSTYYNSQLKYHLNKKIKQLNHQFQVNTKDQLEQFQQEQLLFDDHLTYASKLENLKKNKEILFIKANQTPSKVFKVKFRFCRPYKVIKLGNSYTFCKNKTVFIDTSFYFWRIRNQSLFFLRWISNFIGGTITMFEYLYSGPFGILALCSLQDFFTDEVCDSKTGSISKVGQRQSVISGFIGVLRSMKKCREEFENSPDDGFFGKACARIFNLMEVYLFRFLFIGIFLTLIILPFCIIVNIAFSTFILLTMIVWVTILQFLMLIVQIFLYDFDCEILGNVQKGEQTSQIMCPILYEILGRFFIMGVFQIAWALVGMSLHLLISIIILIFAVTRVILRSIYDTIMFQFIKCFGRIPSRNTPFAWSIKGPGISRSYYYQIQKEDLFTLVYATLESLELQEWAQRTRALVVQPVEASQASVKKFFTLLGVNFNYYDKSTEILLNCLKTQVQRRLSIYPNKPQNTVRFTLNELEVLVPEVTDFIKQTMIRRNMDSFIWDRLGLAYGQYTELTAKIMIQAFNDPKILEPLENIDQRVMLVSQSNLRQQIKRALKGKANLEPIKLQHQTSRIVVNKEDTPIQKHFDLSKLISAFEVTQQPQNSWNSFDQPHLSVFVNCNLQRDKDPLK